MKKILLIVALLTLNLFANSINVAVAANVSYAIDELKEEFKKQYPDIDVRVILGSSGKLTAQIKNGAPYGLFMSANMKYPNALYNEKIATTKPIVYAQGTLAFLSVKKQDFSKGLALLKSKQIRRIAIANPKTAPYGIASRELLKNMNIYEELKSKFIYGESISQTVSYTLSAADVGIVATSSLYSPKMTQYKKDINWISLDSKLYTPIKQGIVLLKHAKNSKAYKAFYKFILSAKAKEILRKYGYII